MFCRNKKKKQGVGDRIRYNFSVGDHIGIIIVPWHGSGKTQGKVLITTGADRKRFNGVGSRINTAGGLGGVQPKRHRGGRQRNSLDKGTRKRGTISGRFMLKDSWADRRGKKKKCRKEKWSRVLV